MFNIYLQNSRTLRRSFLQILKEAIHLCFRPLCKNLHIRPFVADASVNVIFNRMPTHCRTKPNALHNAVNTNLSCLCLIHQHAPPNLPETAKCRIPMNCPSNFGSIDFIQSSTMTTSHLLSAASSVKSSSSFR